MENKHTIRAMELRNEVPMTHNCAQTLLSVYADELGLTENQAVMLSANLGGGMKCGGICGAISGGLLILGAKGVQSPAKVQEFQKRMAAQHEGMTRCADLLKANAARGGNKKQHCDQMIREAIELIDEMTAK